ncbi:hypothetical protein H4219_003935 [Mycoemilia scoparia]|uniref:Uncharacterized protein n=1 Tax=Mycoemilia scoparia TaxID=417184 RepID=A0A9W7ZTB1_9FUNG|nr:hypothetical protein H4219_003935 [Mycoemilia scoparia]
MLQLLLTVVLQKQLLAKYFNRCYELVSIILGLSIPCVSFGFYKPLGWTSYIMEVARLRDSTAEIFLARVGWVFAAAFASFVIAVFVVIKLFPVWRNSYTLSDIGHPDENGNIGTYSSINRNNSSAAGSGGGKRKRHNSNREDILVLPEFRITKDMRLLQQTVLEHKCSEDSVYTATTVEMMKQASSLSSLYPNDLEKQAYEIGYHHSSGYGGNGMRMPKEEEEVPQRQLQHQRQQHHNAGAKRRKVPLKSVQTKQQLAKLRRSILRVMVYPIVTFSVELAIIVANMMGVHYGTLVCINLFRAAQGIFEFFLFLMNPSLDEVWPILLKPVKAGFSKFIN